MAVQGRPPRPVLNRRFFIVQRSLNFEPAL